MRSTRGALLTVTALGERVPARDAAQVWSIAVGVLPARGLGEATLTIRVRARARARDTVRVRVRV